MNLHDFRQYKESKVALVHINTILKIFDLSERSLSHFGAYIPVARVLLVIREQKSILESYKNKYEKINSNKGKIE